LKKNKPGGVILINEMNYFNYLPELPSPTTITINDISIHLYIVENSIWLFSTKHLAKNYGIDEITVRGHLKRNKDTLIEGRDWFKKGGWKPPSWGSGRTLVYKLTGRLNYGVEPLRCGGKSDTFREETDECSETACRSKDGGM